MLEVRLFVRINRETDSAAANAMLTCLSFISAFFATGSLQHNCCNQVLEQGAQLTQIYSVCSTWRASAAARLLVLLLTERISLNAARSAAFSCHKQHSKLCARSSARLSDQHYIMVLLLLGLKIGFVSFLCIPFLLLGFGKLVCKHRNLRLGS